MAGAGVLVPDLTVEEVFHDFKARRSALLKAFTTEFEEFYNMCHPVKLVPADLPEPTLGINFARDGMPKEDWRSIVAVHSDVWLLSVAFFLGARSNFDKFSRKRLFNLINGFPTLHEVATRTPKDLAVERSAVPEHRGSRSKSNSKKSKKSISEAKDEDDDEHNNIACATCGEYSSDEFWICCDTCESWLHGKCVKITPAKAKLIKQFHCPSCTERVCH